MSDHVCGQITQCGCSVYIQMHESRPGHSQTTAHQACGLLPYTVLSMDKGMWKRSKKAVERKLLNWERLKFSDILVNAFLNSISSHK